MTTLRHALLAAVSLATALSLVAPAHGQIVNRKCYKIKDALPLAAFADLDTPQFGVDPGCKISKAKLFCVPAATDFHSVYDKTTGDSLTSQPLSRGPQPGDEICYKAKCPTPVVPIPDRLIIDEFGSRTVTKFKTSYLCTPAVKGASYCGDGTIDAGEECEPTDLDGESCESLGFAPGTLTCGGGCTFDTSACPQHPVPGTCGNGTVEDTERCDGSDLAGETCASLGYVGGTLACRASCAYDTSGCARTFPATGQTTCWNGFTVIPCAGTGQDGEVQAGATLSYTDNGDGTITDDNTRLVWEKLSDDGSIHDKDDLYTWADAFAVKVAALNTMPCFAGHCDWRVPNIREIASLQNLGGSPAISAAFNSGCASGCTVLTCSCTYTSGYYWSSTSSFTGPNSAWIVDFAIGVIGGGHGKGGGVSNPHHVRAVRAGT